MAERCSKYSGYGSVGVRSGATTLQAGQRDAKARADVQKSKYDSDHGSGGGCGGLGRGSVSIVETNSGKELTDADVAGGYPADHHAENGVEDKPLEPGLELVEEEAHEGPELDRDSGGIVGAEGELGGRGKLTQATPRLSREKRQECISIFDDIMI